MEDSYIVHRRRKAAARRREKTPDPSSRGAASRMDTSDDEDEERRTRMERMAEETEKMDQQQKENRLAQQQQEERTAKEPENRDKDKDVHQERPVRKKDRTDTRKSANVDDMIAIRAEVAAKSTAAGNNSGKTDAAAADDNTRLIKQTTEAINKFDDESTTKREIIKAEIDQVVKENLVAQETSETPKETNSETVRPAEVRKVERRFKRKSKERVERYSRSTDSSDADEKSESSQKRTKSPEATRPRAKKMSGKSRISDPEVQKRDAERQNREKKSSSRQKLEDESRTKDDAEKSRSKPHSQTEETDEDLKSIKKNENFSQRPEERMIKKSSIELKKQIIPLNNDSLIEDFARAQREYMLKERSILDPDNTDVFQDAVETSFLRRRKFSLAYTESEEEIQDASDTAKSSDKKKSRFSWMIFWRREQKDNNDIVEEKIEDEPKPAPKVEEIKAEEQEAPEKVTLLDFFRALKDVVGEFKVFIAQNPRETTIIRRLRNRCIAGLLLIMIYCGLGGFIFRFVEGAFESFYKCGVKRVKRDFLDSLWNYSHNLREDDWKSMARRKLMEFEEQLHTAHEAGLHNYSGQKSWSFLNAVAYCLTVITTIGYGHISPSTNAGRAITIVYAIFGIPMFLIILADFGKLFTRGIKFLWAFVRRLYYTGSCRKVRRTGPVQEVMKGMQLVYDFAKFRRPSQMNPEEIEEIQRQQMQQQTVLNLDANAPDTPGTPAMSAYAIDDEFNLPISVAIVILLAYIFIGATLYYMWEEWSFFESFYFVFISMSTIGFGDYVPKNPIYMMCSIVYLVFGLALTSMCINVVQVMLSDSFKQASQKIGATIGFEVAEDDNSVKPAPPPPIEIADVHVSLKESESGEKIAPKAKQEDVDL